MAVLSKEKPSLENHTEIHVALHHSVWTHNNVFFYVNKIAILVSVQHSMLFSYVVIRDLLLGNIASNIFSKFEIS